MSNRAIVVQAKEGAPLCGLVSTEAEKSAIETMARIRARGWGSRATLVVQAEIPYWYGAV